MNTSQRQTPRIVRGRVKMIVSYNGGEIAHISPAVGPNDYQIVGQAIIKQRLSVPHGDYAAPLIHAAYCSDLKDEPEFTNVREDLARKNWLWVFNRNLWTDKGLYVMQDEKALGRSKPLTVESLEAMLKDGRELSKGGIRFSRDNKVRFAPKGSYTLGQKTPESLATDGFMIAQYGLRGAELLAESAATLSKNPQTCGLDIARGKSPQLLISTLAEGDGRLYFIGGVFDVKDGSCAFPVSVSRKTLL